MQNINRILFNFILFLRATWQQLEPIFQYDQTGAMKHDWLQANWELLVEGLLSQAANGKITLEVYSEGADANGASSRILYPNDQPTHAVYCKPKKGRILKDILTDADVVVPIGGVLLDRFVSVDTNGWYYEEMPFDKALVIFENQERVFDIADIDFILEKIR